MNYYQGVIKSRKNRLKTLSETALYEEAYGYVDLEHGVGYYSREALMGMILQHEYKILC